MNLKRLQSTFYELYLNSNSPSKVLYNENGEHHRILKLFNKFMNDEVHLIQMIKLNEEQKLTPTHYFSILYKNQLEESNVFERRCVGYLCSFLIQAHIQNNKNNVERIQIRVNESTTKIQNGQFFIYE